MFKAAKEGPAKVITANDLRDGLVVFLDGEGGWTHDIAAARVVEDGPDLDEARRLRQGAGDARVVVEPYPIDVDGDRRRAGAGAPARTIRAERGPTVVYGEAERGEARRERA